MKIAILGAGVTGSTVGGFLKLAGETVYLLDPNKAHMDAIREHGLVWTDDSTGLDCSPIFFDGAHNDASAVGSCDVVIILTKNPFTRIAIEGHKEIFDKHTTVISFQNGLGTTDTLLDYFDADNIGYGVLYSGGFLISPGHIHMQHANPSVLLRKYSGKCSEVYNKLIDAFNRVDFQAEYCENIDEIIWTKVGVNCFCNMLCGITRLTMQKMLRHPYGNSLVEQIVDEVVAVAKAKGITITPEAILHTREMALVAPEEHYPSGAQDVMHHNMTEVDSLNAEVARIGAALGVPTPVNKTISEIMYIIQDTYEDQF